MKSSISEPLPWQRARAQTAIPAFPMAPSSIMQIFQSDDSIDKQNLIPSKPDNNRAFSPSFGQIYDPRSLLNVVNHNPVSTFEKIQCMVGERDRLRAENKRLEAELQDVKSDLEGSRSDWATISKRYEELCEIGTAKQVLLWRFMERMNSADGKAEPDGKGGMIWIPRNPEKEAKIESNMRVGAWWARQEHDGKKLIQLPTPFLDQATSEGLRSSGDLRSSEGSTISGVDSHTSGVSKEPRLDPSAASFIPSPTKSFSQLSIGPPPPPSAPRSTTSARSDRGLPHGYHGHGGRGGHVGNSGNVGHGGNGSGNGNGGHWPRIGPNHAPPRFSPNQYYNNNYSGRSYSQSLTAPPPPPQPALAPKPTAASPARWVYHAHHNPTNHPYHESPNRKLWDGQNEQISKPWVANMERGPESMSDDIRRIDSLPDKRPTTPRRENSRSPNKLISQKEIDDRVATLIAPFDQICPFSLLELETCHVLHCSLLRVCVDFNTSNCTIQDCKFVHVVYTCLARTEFGSCSGHSRLGETKNITPRSTQQSKKLKRGSFIVVAHPSNCSKEEWASRMMNASLRNVHRVGKWGVGVKSERKGLEGSA